MNNILLKNKFGIIAGFIFGLVIIPFSALGLASYVMEIAAKILVFPMRLVFLGGIYSQFGNYTLFVGTLLNGIFYAFIGFLLHYFLKKKKYVMITFVSIIVLLILLIIIEFFTRGSFIA